MASANRPARLNRTLLLITALLLLAAAAFTLLLGFGVLASLGLTNPERGASLTPSSLSLPTWAPYVTLVIAVLVGLLALRWLLAQAIRKPATGTWRVENDPAAGATSMAAQTAVDPLVDELKDYPGVHRASARLSGTSTRPMLHLIIGTLDTADITELRRRIDSEALPRLRRALDLPQLPADLLIRLDDAQAARLN